MHYSSANRVETERWKLGSTEGHRAQSRGSGKVVKEGITTKLCLEGRLERAVRTGNFDRANGLVDKDNGADR